MSWVLVALLALHLTQTHHRAAVAAAAALLAARRNGAPE